MPEFAARTERSLSVLKDFQRRTVDYVFQRLYLDENPSLRFLIADEVGLGKTLVARGIIARTLEHLRDRVDRLDVVYVCSNASIARQNINRLNVTDMDEVALPTRLTMLPTQVHNLEKNRVNFISLTPGTSLDTKSRGGKVGERLVLWRMLVRVEGISRYGLLNLLQCTVGRDNYLDRHLRYASDVDESLTRQFLAELERTPDLLAELCEATRRFRRYRPGNRYSREDSRLRYSVIGRLRNLLARVCVDALEPDLIILDEFQRFRDLLDGETEAALLTKQLLDFQYRNDAPEAGLRARVLLLSATPYQMYTQYGDEGEDHYEDFLRTCGFLFDDEVELDRLRAEIRDYRRALFSSAELDGKLSGARDHLQRHLLQIMVRTERTSASAARDAMLSEKRPSLSVEVADLRQAEVVYGVARAVEARDPVEYWKSAPYLLNFMRRYQLKEQFEKQLEDPAPDLLETVRRGREHLLHQTAVQEYDPLPPANGRLRGLIRDVLSDGQWRLLWIPPSLPYLEPAGPFASAGRPTKALIFSSWVVVPDAISAVCSYEAERLSLTLEEGGHAYSELSDTARLLDFHMRGEQAGAMNNLTLLYPSPTLAALNDPLKLAQEKGQPLAADEACARMREAARQALDEGGISDRTSQDEWVRDRRWYWAALARLDSALHPDVAGWLTTKNPGWRGTAPEGADESGVFGQHVAEFYQAFDDGLDLGPAPPDLADVLAELALASPAVCALRALRRVVPTIAPTHPVLLTAAAQVAQGLRSLFNTPESIPVVREGTREVPYWRSVLRYGINGNLQAVLDEYVHVLYESLGLKGHSPAEVVEGISKIAQEALSLRTSRVQVDGIEPRPDRRIRRKPFNLRTRFALRFGDQRTEREESVVRAGSVREAFNSPFRPFVLATTSIGQEGLDFHTYCHAVYHWNLPSNPVDLEQREGRVHRYKGHAVRKNLAECYGLAGLSDADGVNAPDDPWERLFECASADRPPDANELVPYWIFDRGRARVERRVPLLPFSREVSELDHLKGSLALYRLAFGQPRQQDLIEYLRRHHDGDGTLEDLDRYRICLEPPEVEWS